MRGLLLLALIASPVGAVSQTVEIRCNIISHCQSEWESPLEQQPPRLKLACKGKAEPVKVSITREPQWQRISYDF